jgi:hypothetical protein
VKLWQRVLFVIVGAAALYALWRFPPTGVVTVLLGVGAAWLGRSIYRSKLAANPMGDSRDYSLRPAATALVKSLGSFAAALLWAASTASAVRLGHIPDTPLGATVVVGPTLLLLAIGVIYLLKSLMKFQFGGKPPAG